MIMSPAAQVPKPAPHRVETRCRIFLLCFRIFLNLISLSPFALCADAVSAYNAAHGTNYAEAQAKEALGQ